MELIYLGEMSCLSRERRGETDLVAAIPEEEDNLTRLGAWGLGLFQSDHDYELIDELDRKAGMQELMMTTLSSPVLGKQEMQGCLADTMAKMTMKRLPKPKRIELSKAVHMMTLEDCENMLVTNRKTYYSRAHMRALGLHNGDEAYIHYSVYADLCSNVDLVRAHLNSGVLAQLIAEYESNFQASPSGGHPTAGVGYQRNGYKLLFLGACAMSLGCNLPSSFILLMKQHLHQVGLKRDADKQLDEALNGPRIYKPGTPYKFRSARLYDAMLAGVPKADRVYFKSDLINVEWPGGPNAEFLRGVSGGGEDVSTDGKDEQSTTTTISTTACANCATDEAEGGGPLLNCAQCRQAKYCSKACQKEHWKEGGHRKICARSRTGA